MHQTIKIFALVILIFLISCSDTKKVTFKKAMLISCWKMVLPEGSKGDSLYLEYYFYDNDSVQKLNDFHYVKRKFVLTNKILCIDTTKYFIKSSQHQEIELYDSNRLIGTFVEYPIEKICHESYSYNRILHHHRNKDTLAIEDEIQQNIDKK